MTQAEYRALKQEIPIFDNLEDVERSPERPITSQRSYSTWIMGFMLIISILLNIQHYIPITSWVVKQQHNEMYSDYAEDIPTTVIIDSRTVDDEVWITDRFNMAHGIVALDDEVVPERGLFPADRYPWDPSKGVYLLQGYHVMHCVFVFRDLILSVRDGIPSFWSHAHLVHCLHTLREETECNANDFPLSIRVPSSEHYERTVPGMGQVRMCRSWDDLRDFALKNTACWSKVGWHSGDPINGTYKRCPDGSKPWEELELV